MCAYEEALEPPNGPSCARKASVVQGTRARLDKMPRSRDKMSERSFAEEIQSLFFFKVVFFFGGGGLCSVMMAVSPLAASLCCPHHMV